MAAASTGALGHQRPEFASSMFDAHQFQIKSMLARVRTATLVKVISVTNAGGLSAVGSVSIQPMVAMVDGAGNSYPHGTISQCPYLRLQGGANAVILDPQVGDIGSAVFADRDISAVQKNRAPSNPGSFRSHDMADGLYLGGVLNATPVQYVQFNASGITVTSPNTVTINASAIALVGNVTSQGTFMNNGVNIGSTHAHAGVQTGSGNSGVPH